MELHLGPLTEWTCQLYTYVIIKTHFGSGCNAIGNLIYKKKLFIIVKKRKKKKKKIIINFYIYVYIYIYIYIYLLHNIDFGSGIKPIQ